MPSISGNILQVVCTLLDTEMSLLQRISIVLNDTERNYLFSARSRSHYLYRPHILSDGNTLALQATFSINSGLARVAQGSSTTAAHLAVNTFFYSLEHLLQYA